MAAARLLIALLSWIASAEPIQPPGPASTAPGSARASGAPPAVFDTGPWIADLHEIRAAFSEKYANFEWAVFERELDLSDLFARTETRLGNATNDGEAKAAIDRLMRALGDGHVRVVWPTNQTAAAATAPGGATRASSLCETLGYDAAKNGRALGPLVPGYRPLAATVAAEFPAGVVRLGGQRVGMIRIGLFSPEGSPDLCASVLNTLAIAADADCDAACADRVASAAYTLLSRDLALRIRALRRLGVTALLIDLTGNGGGSQWAEAAARIVSPFSLRSERLGFVRGAHWVAHWQSLAAELRQAADHASGQDRARLMRWAFEVDRAQAEARTSCLSTPFWSGQHPECEWLGHDFYATGVLAQADAAALKAKGWGSLVFSPAEYEFEEAVWHGPLLVLVDSNTGSAAEEFAAVLQDNKAAAVIGAPTAGAGCGHTNGGTPTTLSHSRAVLELPDCARIRLDGSNEVGGIDPDVLVGFRATDGMRRKGLRLMKALPRGLAVAAGLCRGGRCESRQPSERAGPDRQRRTNRS